MIRTVKIYKSGAVTLHDLAEFVEEATKIGADPYSAVRIHVAPTSPHPTDPGGETTIEISVTS